MRSYKAFLWPMYDNAGEVSSTITAVDRVHALEAAYEMFAATVPKFDTSSEEFHLQVKELT